MALTHPMTAVVVATLLVWGVAFGGGYTLALFSATTNVSSSFTAADEFTAPEPPGDGPAVATVPGVNAPNGTNENASSPPENATIPSDEGVANGSSGAQNETATPETTSEQIGNASAPDGNASAPDENASAPDGNASASLGGPDTNESVPAKRATPGETPSVETPDFEATDAGVRRPADRSSELASGA